LDRILISGASGLIGTALTQSLERSSAQILQLVRGPGQSPARTPEQVGWDSKGELSPAAVSGFQTVIHLAGESVMGRWTPAKKRAIRESRVQGTRKLASSLVQAPVKPKVFICASAIGFYGDRADEILTEESPGGQGFLPLGFLPDVCREWEAASTICAAAGIRTVNVRFGLVLSREGGALAKMLPLFKLGLGGRLGSGKQWWSWVHIDDVVGAIHHALQTPELSGPVNVVSPNPLRNEDFTKLLASVLGRPAFFAVPAFALRLALGEAAHELMLASQRVLPQRLQTTSYTFRFNDLRSALESLV
jgi:uncharacterized protein (TIGR01777 family)